MSYEIIDYSTRKRLDMAKTKEEAHARVLELRKAGHRDAVYRSTKRVKSDGPAGLRRLL